MWLCMLASQQTSCLISYNETGLQKGHNKMKNALLSKKLGLLLATGAFLALPVAVHAATTVDTESKMERDDNGGYSSTTEMTKTDEAGTTGTSKETVSVDKHDDGSMEKVHETKSTVDPKGLFNKSTEKTRIETTKDKDGNVVRHFKKELNGKTVEETTEKQ